MHDSKEQLAEEYGISKEEVEKVLRFVRKRTRQILSGDWREDTNFQAPDPKEIRKSKKIFKEAMGVLFLTNYEQYPNHYVKAIGNLVAEAFKPGSINNPKESYYQHFDVEYITFCIQKYLTETERKVLRLRYGMMDGRKRTYETIARILNHTYSRQWICSIAKKAERKLLFRWDKKESEGQKK